MNMDTLTIIVRCGIACTLIGLVILVLPVAITVIGDSLRDIAAVLGARASRPPSAATAAPVTRIGNINTTKQKGITSWQLKTILR